MMAMRLPLFTACATGAMAMGTPVAAQTMPQDLTGLKAELEEMTTREAEARARIDELETRIRRLETVAARISDVEAGAMRGANATSPALARSDEATLAYFQERDSDAQDAQRKTPAPSVAVEEVTAERQGRFGRRFGIDLGMNYTHFDNARINLDGFLALDTIFLGTISIDRVSADILTFDPVVRVGLSDRLFVNAGIPYFYRSTNFRSGGAGADSNAQVEKTVHGRGFGDASIGASYRLFSERGARPDIVLNGRLKFPTGKHPYGIEFEEVQGSEGNLMVPTRLSTGTGVYGLSVGVSALKTLDPMVVFGNVSYFRNFARKFDDISEADGDQPGRVNVGNAIQLGAGLAYALNDQSSISMSYTQRFVQHTKTQPDGGDWREVVGSQANVALVNLGATFSLGDRMSLVSNVGVGLTDDSPDMSVSVRLPVSF